MIHIPLDIMYLSRYIVNAYISEYIVVYDVYIVIDDVYIVVDDVSRHIRL